MATQQAPTIITVPAGSDLSTKQFYFMDISSGQLSVAGDGTRVAGVLLDDPDAAGAPGALQIAGVAKVLAGGSISSGGGVASSATGTAVASSGSDFVCGIALTDADSGDYVEVILTGSSAVGLAANSEAISAAGALSTGIDTTYLSVSGTKAYTLAAPSYVGQVKNVVCVAAASTPAGTLTVTSPDDTTGFVCPATFFFDAVGQQLTLKATAALKWRCIAKKRVGFKELVVGTTETTGICDMSHINLSVTGTVASLTTKGIPNGAAIGEILLVGCGTAASTPHGDIAITALGTFGTAATALDDFTATTDHLLFSWSGAAWQLLSNNSAAVTLT